MSDIERVRILEYKIEKSYSNESYCRSEDVAKLEIIMAKLEETNRLLRRDLDEAARIGKARGLRIKELEEEVRKILCG